MQDEKFKPRKCAKCKKTFTPTIERKLTCKNCYGTNSNVSPLAEEPGLQRSKNQFPSDEVFHRIHSSPTDIK